MCPLPRVSVKLQPVHQNCLPKQDASIRITAELFWVGRLPTLNADRVSLRLGQFKKRVRVLRCAVGNFVFCTALVVDVQAKSVERW